MRGGRDERRPSSFEQNGVLFHFVVFGLWVVFFEINNMT